MIDTDDDFAPPVGTRRRVKRGRRIFVTLAVVILLGVGAFGAYVSWAMGGSRGGAPVQVVIPHGASSAQIATLLQNNGVVRSAFVFRLVAQWRGVTTSFRAGTYEFRRGMGVSAVISALQAGIKPITIRFTIPEGKTVREIADIVAQNTPVSAADFLRAARSGTYRAPFLPLGARNLEGVLFPATYDVLEKVSAGEIVGLLTKQFGRETESLGLSHPARPLGLTPYQVIVAASLIEREASSDKDRPLIASVIVNRLRRHQRLQIDATVQYAIQLQTGRYKGTALTQDDYTAVHSPYNTYLIDGLPPAPIASPGLAAIEAALHPATTDFLYYRLCDSNHPSRGHVFARTIGERDRLASVC